MIPAPSPSFFERAEWPDWLWLRLGVPLSLVALVWLVVSLKPPRPGAS